jgi:hypothetical protein
MNLPSFLRPKTVLSYRPTDIYKSPRQLVASPKLVRILTASLKTLRPDDIVTAEETLRTILNLLTQDLESRTLSAEDMKLLNESVPQLLPLLPLVKAFTRLHLIDFLVALNTRDGHDQLLKQLVRASELPTLFTDDSELLSLRALLRYFIVFQDPAAFGPLNAVWLRARDRKVGVAGFDVVSQLVQCLGRLAVASRHAPSLTILKDASAGYGLSGHDLNEARRYVTEAETVQGHPVQ